MADGEKSLKSSGVSVASREDWSMISNLRRAFPAAVTLASLSGLLPLPSLNLVRLVWRGRWGCVFLLALSSDLETNLKWWNSGLLVPLTLLLLRSLFPPWDNGPVLAEGFIDVEVEVVAEDDGAKEDGDEANVLTKRVP